jgi:hypothetical protein
VPVRFYCFCRRGCQPRLQKQYKGTGTVRQFGFIYWLQRWLPSYRSSLRIYLGPIIYTYFLYFSTASTTFCPFYETDFWIYTVTLYTVDSSLLRRGLHEVSSEGKVSAQGVMGRAK